MDYKDMTDEQLREVAAKRVKARKEFRMHLFMYLLVNAFLLIIYWINTPGGYPWFIYPLCGWGIGIVAHAIETRSILSKSHVDAIEDEIEKLKRM